MTKFQNRATIKKVLVIWKLEFRICLGFGYWDWDFGHPYGFSGQAGLRLNVEEEIA